MIGNQFHTECRSIDSRRTHRRERVGWVYGWSGNEYRDPGRRDTHRSAGRMVCCKGILLLEKAGMVRGEMRLPAPHPPDDRIGSGSRQLS